MSLEQITLKGVSILAGTVLFLTVLTDYAGRRLANYLDKQQSNTDKNPSDYELYSEDKF